MNLRVNSVFVGMLLLAVITVNVSKEIHTKSDRHLDECTGRERKTVFSHIALEDCYRAWKYGVTYVDEIEGFYTALCQPDCFAALQSLEDQCGASEDTEYSIEYLDNVCAKNEAGVSCYQVAMMESDLMQRVYANCWALDNGGGHGCSQECHNTIKEFSDRHGCCVNAIYNSSVARSDTTLTRLISYVEEMGVTNYGLWSSCNIQLPKHCYGNNFASSATTRTHEFITIVTIFTGLCVTLFQ